MWPVELLMPRLPLSITCHADATVSFAPIARFDVCIDQMEDGSQVVVNEQQISLGQGNVIEYNGRVPYKENPALLAWLQSLQMNMPRFT